MKFVIQRVQHASVTVDNEVIGKIGKGFLVLIGVSEEDNTEIADKMIKKLIGMRIFEDENGKTNLALKDVNGELQTAKKEIVHPLLKQEIRSLQTAYMNISLRHAKKNFRL